MHARMMRGLIVLGLVVTSAACGGGGGGARHAMPAGATWDGKWDTSFGPMILETKGAEVVGAYKYNLSGNEVIGVIQGTSKDNVIEFNWLEQKGGAGSGRGIFYMSNDGNAFEGTWGSGDNNKNGGGWRGHRM